MNLFFGKSNVHTALVNKISNREAAHSMVVPFVKTVFGQKEDKTQLFKKLALTF
jgi:hypothetical protein